MLPLFLISKVAGSPLGTVLVTNHSPTVLDVSSPYDSHVGIRVTSGGLLQTSASEAGASWSTESDEWISPPSAASRKTYHVRFTYTGDTLDVGSESTGSWVEITGTHFWSLSKTDAGTTSGSGTLSISDDGGSTTLDSGTITLSIENA